jgi:hypothetical protein
VERHRQNSTIVTSNREGPAILSMMADQLLGQSALDRLPSAALKLVVEGVQTATTTLAQPNTRDDWSCRGRSWLGSRTSPVE